MKTIRVCDKNIEEFLKDYDGECDIKCWDGCSLQSYTIFSQDEIAEIRKNLDFILNVAGHATGCYDAANNIAIILRGDSNE